MDTARQSRNEKERGHRAQETGHRGQMSPSGADVTRGAAANKRADFVGTFIRSRFRLRREAMAREPE